MKRLLLLCFVGLLAFSFTGKTPVVPYKVDKRPLPSGSDFLKIMPEQVGAFKRTGYHEPTPDMDGDATYVKPDSTKVFMLFGGGISSEDAQSVFSIVVTEATNKNTVKPDALVQQKDPSYILMKKKSDGVSFFGWTHGAYYFSVETHQGEAALDEFMKSFPY